MQIGIGVGELIGLLLTSGILVRHVIHSELLTVQMHFCESANPSCYILLCQHRYPIKLSF